MHRTLVVLFTVSCASGNPIDSSESELNSSGHAWIKPIASNHMFADFNVVNPYVYDWGSCFNKPLNQLVHAGEDWQAPAGTPVYAMGEGVVVFAAFVNYKGSVIVIRHDLDATERAALGITNTSIYSQYGHVDGLVVGYGSPVTAGQQIGRVWDWGSNSHLHWEVRTVKVPQLCSYTIPGPGYTNTGTDARNWGYLDATSSLSALANAGVGTCDNNVPLESTACAFQGDTVEYVCKRPGWPSSQQWDARGCPAGSTCVGTTCQASWNCADSAWGTAQLWTCGGGGDRHKCQGGVPVEDDCASGCYGRSAGQDDLCIQSDPGWSCASSAYGTSQLWTCSGGIIHKCVSGAPVKVGCPSGCTSQPLGYNDYCN